MAHITFYEKPGCANNTRQKRLLADAGHSVDPRNLLTEAWTEERLLAFFGERPVAEWFNKAAPKVKSGEVVPENQNAAQALALMLAEPLLIRRPLMEVGTGRMVGFDMETVMDWIGLAEHADLSQDLQTCTKQHVGAAGCPPPK